MNVDAQSVIPRILIAFLKAMADLEFHGFGPFFIETYRSDFIKVVDIILQVHPFHVWKGSDECFCLRVEFFEVKFGVCDR